jgi:hypothetical protein
MTAAERISAFAGVDLELAELVVRAAQVHHVHRCRAAPQRPQA